MADHDLSGSNGRAAVSDLEKFHRARVAAMPDAGAERPRLPLHSDDIDQPGLEGTVSDSSLSADDFGPPDPAPLPDPPNVIDLTTAPALGSVVDLDDLAFTELFGPIRTPVGLGPPKPDPLVGDLLPTVEHGTNDLDAEPPPLAMRDGMRPSSSVGAVDLTAHQPRRRLPPRQAARRPGPPPDTRHGTEDVLAPSSRSYRYRVVMAGVTFAALTVVAGLTIAYLRRTSTGVAHPPAAAATTRDTRASAEAWLETNAPRASVLVDRQTGVDLLRRGWPASRVQVYGADGTLEPVAKLGRPPAAFVVTTAASPRSGATGTLEVAERTSVVVAQFGSGEQRVQIRQVVPVGSSAAAASQQADRAFRLEAGRELLFNQAVSETPAATQTLRTGQVDGPLASTLAALALTHRFTIGAFPSVTGETGPGAVRRQVQILAIDGHPVRPGAIAVSQAIGFFQAQVGIFRPAHVGLSSGGRSVLTIGYPLPATPA